MKKLFQRLRTWLIRKLGGAMPVDVGPVIVREETRPVTTVRVETVLRSWMMELPEETTNEYIRRKLAEELAGGLMKNNMVDIEYIDDFLPNCRVYAATLRVVEPRNGMPI